MSVGITQKRLGARLGQSGQLAADAAQKRVGPGPGGVVGAGDEERLKLGLRQIQLQCRQARIHRKRLVHLPQTKRKQYLQ